MSSRLAFGNECSIVRFEGHLAFGGASRWLVFNQDPWVLYGLLVVFGDFFIGVGCAVIVWSYVILF